MKELSIEQKAQRYDEAIKRIENINTGKCETKFIFTEGLFEHIFPELKESEDERIKQKIIKLVKMSNKVGGFALHKWEADEMIAWLEKQDEQKSKFRVGDTIKSKYDDRQFTIKSVDLDKGTYTYTQEGCGNDIDYADEEFELVEQKPVAWSEEDEMIALSIEQVMNCASLLNIVPEKIDKIRTWLKSLKDRYTWKPTEEQIKALHNLNLTGDISYMGQGQTLLELYNDLKKLMKK